MGKVGATPMGGQSWYPSPATILPPLQTATLDSTPVRHVVLVAYLTSPLTVVTRHITDSRVNPRKHENSAQLSRTQSQGWVRIKHRQLFMRQQAQYHWDTKTKNLHSENMSRELLA